jgi:hypothetical protein
VVLKSCISVAVAVFVVFCRHLAIQATTGHPHGTSTGQFAAGFSVSKVHQKDILARPVPRAAMDQFSDGLNPGGAHT